MDQSGVLQKIIRKWRANQLIKIDCLNPNPNVGVQVDLKMVVTAFCILGVALIFASLVLPCEKVYSIRKTPNQ